MKTTPQRSGKLKLSWPELGKWIRRAERAEKTIKDLRLRLAKAEQRRLTEVTAETVMQIPDAKLIEALVFVTKCPDYEIAKAKAAGALKEIGFDAH